MRKKAQIFNLMRFVICIKSQKVQMLRKCHPSPSLNYVLSLLIGTISREGHSESGIQRDGSARSVQSSTKFVLTWERREGRELRRLGNLLWLLDTAYQLMAFKK